MGLIGWLLLTAAAAVVGGMASAQAPDFYARLAQPAWAPPAWVFAPVWTALYVLMAIAAWLVWRRHGFGGAGRGLTLYVCQLVANALWTWLYFGWQQGALAFADIVVLWVLVAATMSSFARLHKGAALMLLPYLAWVSFAAVLSFRTWRLNPALLG